MAQARRVGTAAQPGSVMVSVDMRNAFNTVRRQAVVDAVATNCCTVTCTAALHGVGVRATAASSRSALPRGHLPCGRTKRSCSGTLHPLSMHVGQKYL
jgi:hypothetical protein